MERAPQNMKSLILGVFLRKGAEGLEVEITATLPGIPHYFAPIGWPCYQLSPTYPRLVPGAQTAPPIEHELSQSSTEARREIRSRGPNGIERSKGDRDCQKLISPKSMCRSKLASRRVKSRVFTNGVQSCVLIRGEIGLSRRTRVEGQRTLDGKIERL